MKTILQTIFLICLFLFGFSSQAMACGEPQCPSCYSGPNCDIYTPGPTPATPTNLDANAVDCNINLTWTDNAYNETSYMIERSTNGVDFNQIDITGAFSGTGTYNDTNGTEGLLPATQYWYRVRAYSYCGSYSNYSNTDSNTTWAGQATDPIPFDDANAVSISPTLKWTPGAGAEEHRVWFDGSYNGWQHTNSFILIGLAYNETYDWRVDEKDSNDNITVGDTWSFKTVCLAPAIIVSPSNEETEVSATTDLQWTWSGGSAQSQDVYFGTTSPGTYRGNIDDGDETSFNLGALDTNTTYYWRIDRKNDCGTATGEVWSFTTGSAPAPGQATNPTPPSDWTKDASVMTDLSWIPGAYATSHDVYLGTSSSEVNYANPGTTGVFRGNQTGTTFDPCLLDLNEEYYWRIDEKNGAGTTKGGVWYFPTPVCDSNKYVSNLLGSDENDGSPGHPYKTIQKGIDETPTGYKVIVMPGTYEEDIDFDGNSITVTSLDPNDPAVVAATIIDGNANAVTFNSEEGPDSVLTGFTIEDANRGIYCYLSSPTVSNCVIKDNQTSGSGAGMWNRINASPTVTNCIFKNNTAQNSGGGVYNYFLSSPQFINCIFSENSVNSVYGGGGMHNYSNSSPIIKNCVFFGNEGLYGSSIRNVSGSPEIINCSFIDNHCSEYGAIYNQNSNPIITNCILGGTTSPKIVGGDPVITYCDIAEEAYPGEGNIDADPCFVNPDDPDGEDNIFGTPDDGLRLRADSPCIDAADGDVAPDTDVFGQARLDIIGVPNTGIGNPDYVDIGAYEYDDTQGYITSFEEYQGYAEYSSIDGNDGWELEGSWGKIKRVDYYENSDVNYPYQYVEVCDSNIVYNMNGSCNKYMHFNCIPSPGSSINIMNGSTRIASITFSDEGDIYVLDGGIYKMAWTGLDYRDIAEQCRYFVENGSSYLSWPDYSYENSWMDFMIQFDWENHQYNVSWTHYAAQAGETIYTTETGFNPDCQYYTKVKFEDTPSDPDFDFMLNRMSIMDIDSEGGVVDPNGDFWMTTPTVPKDANILNPLRGQCAIGGTSWYKVLGEYVVKCCPVDLNPYDANSWMQVCAGKTVGQDLLRLGYWNIAAYYNGDYFLKIQVYDDLRQLHSEGIITDERTYNGQQPETINVKYPIIGRLKPQAFYYQERPDFTINWPGTFPFEFKRSYNHGARSRIFPLFFGWTHNHNIRLIEDSTDDWVVDSNGLPIRDGNGLGVGRLWLCEPSGGGLFIGRVDEGDTQRVIYEPVDNENSYIIRRNSLVPDSGPGKFDVNYVYYDMSNGMKMTFSKEDVNYYHAVPDENDGGLVGWMVLAGIGSQEDRFGNALHYTWEQWDGNDVSLQEISNNRTPARLVFANDLLGAGSFPLCSKIQLYNGDDPCDAYVFFELRGSVSDHIYYYVTRGIGDSPGSPGGEGQNSVDRITYSQKGEQYKLASIVNNFEWMEMTYASSPRTWVNNDDDGLLIEKHEGIQYIAPSYGTISSKFDYDYDDQGNLITTVKVRLVGSADESLREEVVVTSPDGALLSTDISTYEVNLPDGNKFDPCDYHFWWNWNVASDIGYNGDIRLINFHPGGGGAVDTEYYYEDSNFPLKPTTIIEYFDDDGDGDYDRPSRKTEIKYDDRGNTIEKKAYVDDINYVYTEIVYHDVYDFPTRQTTWQEYCQGDMDGNTITYGEKVEKQWLYGSAEGTLCEDGNCGDYLVLEKTLLNDDGGGEWAETSYTYYSDMNGLPRQKTDPANSITYYEYDDNGYVSKVWEGATLDVSGEPVGNPQQRFYYDGLGHKILQADYLGKVEMNVCDALGQVCEARVYIDKTALQRQTFEPSDYDGIAWDSRTLYNWYFAGGRPWNTILPTGGSIYNAYVHNGKSSRYYNLRDSAHNIDGYSVGDWGGDIIYEFTFDGRSLHERKRYEPSLDFVHIDSLYDSMFRPIHKYTHIPLDTECVEDCNCDPNDPNCDPEFTGTEYIRHEEFRYDASGNKIGEKVYKAKLRKQYEGGEDEVLSVALEKSNSYEYDIFGRMTKQIIDSNDEGLNQTTQFGYDALGNRIYVIDPEGKVILTDYDNANRKTKEYFAAEPVYIQDTNDINVIAVRAAADVKKEFHYYKDGKIKDVNSYDYGGALLACSTFTYDSRGRIETVTEKIDDSNNATTSYEYSDSNSLQRVVDDSGYHIVIQDAEGKRTGIKLSYHGKPEKITYPSGDYEQYIYNSNGLLQSKAVWEGEDKWYINYGYDAFGKVETITYPDDPYYGYLEYEYRTPHAYQYGWNCKIRLLGKYGLPTRITDNRDVNDRPGVADSNFMFIYWYELGKIRSYTDYDGYTVNYDYSFAYRRPTDVNVTNPAGGLIYDVNYVYDLAGRITDVCEPLLGTDSSIAGFEYDDNGNRSKLSYFLDGSKGGDTTYIAYSYNRDNMLTSYETTDGPMFRFYNVTVDGLGRLKHGRDIIAFPGQASRIHNLDYAYDMRSQLTDANIGGIDGGSWVYNYLYRLDGNIWRKILNSNNTDYEYDTTPGGGVYDSDLMTEASSDSLTWDLKNGWLIAKPSISFTYNWEGKLRSATYDSNSISIKYDPMGNRVYKNSTENGQRKYIIDISGELPTILMDINTVDGATMKTYIYADSQILAQHDGDSSDPRYFYLHDRLGSVREIIDTDGDVVNSYTYNPFGEMFPTECNETVSNTFKFTGQFFDEEISQYYLRARMYDPALMRFTARDPLIGTREEPLTLHKYLYCLNNSINLTDPAGKEGDLTSTTGAISIGEGLDYLLVSPALKAFAQTLVIATAITIESVIIAHYAASEEFFRGGKITQRDNWHGFDQKPDFHKFAKWLHKMKRKLFGKRGKGLTEEELKDAWDTWNEWGRPSGGK